MNLTLESMLIVDGEQVHALEILGEAVLLRRAIVVNVQAAAMLVAYKIFACGVVDLGLYHLGYGELAEAMRLHHLFGLLS